MAFLSEVLASIRTAFGPSPKHATQGFDQDEVLRALIKVKLPGSGKDIVSLGMVSGITIRKVKPADDAAEGFQVSFAIEVDPAQGKNLEPVRRAAEQAVYNLPEVSSVSAVMTAHKVIAISAPVAPAAPTPLEIPAAIAPVGMPTNSNSVAPMPKKTIEENSQAGPRNGLKKRIEKTVAVLAETIAMISTEEEPGAPHKAHTEKPAFNRGVKAAKKPSKAPEKSSRKKAPLKPVASIVEAAEPESKVSVAEETTAKMSKKSERKGSAKTGKKKTKNAVEQSAEAVTETPVETPKSLVAESEIPAEALTVESRETPIAEPVAPAQPSEPAPFRMPERKPKERIKISLPNVRRIIAVASGKGGVGKSTTAVNLAVAFMQNGLRVGLLDADIYGPSIPRMLALKDKPRTNSNNKMLPINWNGLSVMSMGFLVDEETPTVWRGPMVHTAVTQLFRDVAWGALDILVVDLPPGTGDAQLTLSQNVALAGAVIVSTPQDIALIDARKGLRMFQRVDVPVLGIIENMSYFFCPHCSERTDIFSHGGAYDEAEKCGVPFLGQLPLDPALREHGDDGVPLVYADRAGDIAATFRAMAKAVWKDLNKEIFEQPSGIAAKESA